MNLSTARSNSPETGKRGRLPVGFRLRGATRTQQTETSVGRTAGGFTNRRSAPGCLASEDSYSASRRDGDTG
jgi:hypothetical protein